MALLKTVGKNEVAWASCNPEPTGNPKFSARTYAYIALTQRGPDPEIASEAIAASRVDRLRANCKLTTRAPRFFKSVIRIRRCVIYPNNQQNRNSE